MDKIDELIEKQKMNITNHGWVNGETLRKYWEKTSYWLYPCTFDETCCLTAMEASIHKTLVITNDRAGLRETVDNRGIIIPGNPKDEGWQIMALNRIINIMNGYNKGEVNNCIDRNYNWVKSKMYDTVVPDFVKKYIE